VNRVGGLVLLLACTRDAPLPAFAVVHAEHSAHVPVEALDPTLQRMSLVRGLVATHNVQHVVLTRAELIEKLEEHVARTVPHAEIVSEELFLKGIGVLAADADYERSVYAALRESAAGMYEPFDKKMYLPDDLESNVGALSLAHESVHALQDQHFDLGALERYLPGASDTMLARACLAEGDATNATDASAESDHLDTSAVTYIEREIAAPYVTGTTFVHALRRRGGWALVDSAWRRGGLTTEQLLHPEKWLTHEPALDVPAPTFATLGPEAKFIATDVRGELGLRLVLESAVPSAAAAAASDGWGGDSLVIVRSGASVSLAWRVRFDDERSARASFPIVSEAFSARACSVTQAARDVLILVGPAHETCVRWAKEILVSSPP